MTQRTRARIAALATAVFIALSGTAHAQAVRGTLLGTVHDAQGAAVPGATVTAVETQTNISRSAVTNTSGNYVFANMKDGRYRVETELTGFKKFSRDNVEVKVNSTVRVDLVLEVGNMEETVEVVQETPALVTDRADTGRTIEGCQVQQMPLGLNRNFQTLWATVPGTVTMTRPHSQFFNPQDSQETKFNGQSRLSNNVQVDGLDNNHKTGLLTVFIPSAEAIDSVNVSTSNFEAEFGRAGGSVTTVVLRSGTNQLKGSAFYFGNSEATQAKSYFASATAQKPETKYQQFGGTLGGPVIKDKLFFFADYQHTVDNLGALRRVVIPPTEWRNGDFSTASTTIYDPATGNPDGTGRAPFPGNVIPTNRLSPVALNILAKLPQPNVPGAAFGQVNYELPSSEREKTTDAFNVKLNYNPGVSDQLSLRFSYQRPEIFVPGTFGDLGGAGADFAGSGYQNTYSTALTWTRTLSPSVIMEWRGGYIEVPQRGAQHRDGPRHLERGGDPRRQLRRVLERHQPDRAPERLHRADAGLLRQPALGPRRGNLQRRGHAHEDHAATTRSRSGARSATTRTSCSRSRTRAGCAASSSSTPRVRRSPPTREPRPGSPTRSPRSCWTCRAGSSATSR